MSEMNTCDRVRICPCMDPRILFFSRQLGWRDGAAKRNDAQQQAFGDLLRWNFLASQMVHERIFGRTIEATV
jgi:hypothetical protein